MTKLSACLGFVGGLRHYEKALLLFGFCGGIKAL